MERITFASSTKPSGSNRQYIFPPLVILSGLNAAWIVYILITAGNTDQNYWELVLPITASLFLIALYFKIIPLIEQQPQYLWLPLAVIYGMGNLAGFFAVEIPFGYLAVFVLGIICVPAILEGRKTTYGLTVVVSLTYIFSAWLRQTLSFVVIQNTLILLPLAAILMVETILHQKHTIQTETHRLSTLNNVARSLASSLEMHQVISLVTTAIQFSLSADTYYVGMINGDSVHMELLFDDGEFFPSTNIPIKDTLAEQVIGQKQAILISDVDKYRHEPRVRYRVVGQPRVSQSWMGTPLEAYGEPIGIIAVASYRKNAFTQEDLDMMVNIGQQASLALVNARHHTEVENRSQRDSLTGTLNHSSFLSMLEAQVRAVKVFRSSLSIIMIDIDFFKQYNDQYGHLVGDHVLVEITKEIQRCIKKTDFIGRWGGEEFIVCLPDTLGKHAYQVASRIRASLTNLTIRDRDNNLIPLPTISQGIAVFPHESETIEEVIDLADQRLYTAKARGRDQVEPELTALEITNELNRAEVARSHEVI